MSIGFELLDKLYFKTLLLVIFLEIFSKVYRLFVSIRNNFLQNEKFIVQLKLQEDLVCCSENIFNN